LVKKLVLVAAAFVAAVAVYVGVTLPPRPIRLSAPTDGTIPGIIHVHTNRSDGLSGPDDIAAAAERIRKAGGRDLSPIHTVSTSTGTVAKNMFFVGPSGERVELMQIVSGEF